MHQLGKIGLGQAELAKHQLTLARWERACDLANVERGMAQKIDDLRHVVGQGLAGGEHGRWLSLRLQALEEKHRLGKHLLPGLAPRPPPGGVQTADVATCETVQDSGTSQLEASLLVTTKKRHQILHRRVRRQLAFTHKILDLLRQLLHQGETP